MEMKMLEFSLDFRAKISAISLLIYHLITNSLNENKNSND